MTSLEHKNTLIIVCEWVCVCVWMVLWAVCAIDSNVCEWNEFQVETFRVAEIWKDSKKWKNGNKSNIHSRTTSFMRWFIGKWIDFTFRQQPRDSKKKYNRPPTVITPKTDLNFVHWMSHWTYTTRVWAVRSLNMFTFTSIFDAAYGNWYSTSNRLQLKLLRRIFEFFGGQHLYDLHTFVTE